MSGLLLVLLLGGLAALVALLLLLVHAATRRDGEVPQVHLTVDDLAGATRARRRSLVVALVATAGGAVTTLMTFSGALDALPGLGLGRGRLLAVSAGAVVGVVVICLGELTSRAPRGQVRHAGLQARTPVDFVRRRPAALAASGVAVLGAVLVLGTLLASPDDMGRAGRSISIDCGPVGGGHGPFPGSFYTVPVAIAGVVLLTLAAVTLRAIARRPSIGAQARPVDDLLRRAASTRVVASVALAAWATVVPLALAVAWGLRAVSRPIVYGVDGVEQSVACAPGWYQPLSVSLLCLALVSVLAAGWCLVEVLTAGRAGEPGVRALPEQPADQAVPR